MWGWGVGSGGGRGGGLVGRGGSACGYVRNRKEHYRDQVLASLYSSSVRTRPRRRVSRPWLLEAPKKSALFSLQSEHYRYDYSSSYVVAFTPVPREYAPDEAERLGCCRVFGRFCYGGIPPPPFSRLFWRTVDDRGVAVSYLIFTQRMAYL